MVMVDVHFIHGFGLTSSRKWFINDFVLSTGICSCVVISVKKLRPNDKGSSSGKLLAANYFAMKYPFARQFFSSLEII